MAFANAFDMTLHDVVKARLADWPAPAQCRRGIVVSTHCLYTSGAVVRVVVEGGASEFLVHDDEGALSEFSGTGATNPRAAMTLRNHFADRGMLISPSGRISSPPVAEPAMAPTIALIANASREAEELLSSRWKPQVRRNFKRLLRTLLEAEFPRLHPAFRIAGASHKQHAFDFAIDRMRGGKILLDAVHNDANSINSALVRNLDVQRSGRSNLEQRIIYDDAEEWQAQEINLLKMGATVIPFSQVSSVVGRLTAL